MKKIIQNCYTNPTIVFVAQTMVLFIWAVLILLTIALFAAACSHY
jgi:hypothetical protein